MNYKDVVVQENDGKVFNCKVIGNDVKTEMLLQVYWDGEHTTSLYNYEDQDDLKQYEESEVIDILNEIEVYKDTEDSDEGVIDWKELEPFMIQSNVFAFDNKEELELILKYLDNPIIDDAGFEDDNEYIKSLDKYYGVVFYWSEFDDFSCYGDGYTHWCKIITGVKQV